VPYKDKLERKKYHRKYYMDRQESMQKRQKLYRKNNHEEIRKSNREYFKEHQEKIKKYFKLRNLKYKHNLSYKDWLSIWEEQNGKCLICGKTFTKPSDAHVDHNHETGEIRGLLCGKCNRGIGMFDDNPEIMIKAIEYLERRL